MEKYPTIKIDDFRTEFEVGEDRYFMEFLPGDDLNGFKYYLIQFGILDHTDAYNIKLNRPLPEVNKILNTIGTLATEFVEENKLRYLIFNPLKEEGVSGPDTVRSRMFIRWINQNLPNQPAFIEKGVVGIDYGFLYEDLNECQMVSSEIPWQESCPNLSQEFFTIITPIFKDYKIVVRERDFNGEIQHFLYSSSNIYKLSQVEGGFSLNLNEDTFTFTTTQEFESILKQ